MSASRSASGLEHWIGCYAQWVVRRRVLVLVVVTLVSVVFASFAKRLHVEIDPDRLLPQEHPYIETLNDVHRVFGDKNLVVIGLFPRDGNIFTPRFLRKLAEVTARIERIPGVNPALVQSLAASHLRTIRGTADGIEVEPLMPEVPTDLAAAEALRDRLLADDLYAGALVARDGTAAGIQASFELTPTLPDYKSLHARVVDELASVDDGTFEYALSGPVVFASHLGTKTAGMALLFPLALVVIAAVHYEAFRTFQALVLPLLTALLSVLWALGLMGMLGIQFDPYNITTPILILALAAGHAVQVLKRFYEELNDSRDVQTAIVDALRRVGPVMLAAGTVAAMSFCSLASFRMATIRTFGLLAGFGVVSAMVIELTVIPALRALLPAPRRAERSREAAARPVIGRLLRLSAYAATPRGSIVVLGVVVGLIAVSASYGARLKVDTSYKRAFDRDDRVWIDDARINDALAGTNTLVVLVEGDGEGALEEPRVMQAIAALERRLESEPGVGSVISYVDVVRRIHQEMNRDRQDVEALPGSRRLAAQYLFLHSLSGGADSLTAMLDEKRSTAKIRVLTHEDSTRYGESLIATARRVVADTFPPDVRVRYSGSLASGAAATDVLVEGKLRNIAQIAGIVILVSSVLLRSLIGGIFVAVPLLVTVAAIFGVMGLLGLPLDVNTATTATIAVGIGTDYAMYLLFRTREELRASPTLEAAIARAVATSGTAVVFVSTAVAAGYFTLCLSGFSHYVRLGGLVAFAMVVSSMSAILIVSALAVRIRPRFLARVHRVGRHEALVKKEAA